MFLSSRSETRGVDIAVFGFEAVETPDECKFEVAGHIADFHAVGLPGLVDCHHRRPAVQDIIGFQIEFAATPLAELPLHSGIDFPHGRQIGDTLQ